MNKVLFPESKVEKGCRWNITQYNPFGFPAPEAIERCVERNIPIYRTDINGAVHAVSDGLEQMIVTESDRDINAQVG